MPPDPKWPGGARVAVQFVINYEEGSEECVLDGDAQSEFRLSEIVGAPPYKGQRHLNMESLYEYGSRAGFWRLHRFAPQSASRASCMRCARTPFRGVDSCAHCAGCSPTDTCHAPCMHVRWRSSAILRLHMQWLKRAGKSLLTATGPPPLSPLTSPVCSAPPMSLLAPCTLMHPPPGTRPPAR